MGLWEAWRSVASGFERSAIPVIYFALLSLMVLQNTNYNETDIRSQNMEEISASSAIRQERSAMEIGDVTRRRMARNEYRLGACCHTTFGGLSLDLVKNNLQFSLTSPHSTWRFEMNLNSGKSTKHDCKEICIVRTQELSPGDITYDIQRKAANRPASPERNRNQKSLNRDFCIIQTVLQPANYC